MKSFVDALLAPIASQHARREYRRFLKAAHQASRVQEKVLQRKIARTSSSDYGRCHNFGTIRSYEDFITRVPVQTYEDFRPYVRRVMDGDHRAMFGAGMRVHMFAMTSGSTDKPKYVPVTTAFLREYRRGWNVFGVKALLDHRDAILRSILQVVSPMDEQRTHFNTPCGSISGLLASNQKRIVKRYYVTPPITARISDPVTRYYTIMRYAVPVDVAWMVTASPATQLKLAKAAQAHAPRLIRDIHDGTIKPPGDIDDAVRTRLMANTGPDPHTARRLERILEREGALLPKHYWNLSFLANWTGGTMGLHLREFPYYFGDVPVRDIGLLATEGRVSIPVADGTPNGVLDVTSSFFEFVEKDAGDDRPDAILRCHELRPGCDYRLLMTTSAGFYRYDIGDYVRVHGFEGEAPIIEFLHRGAHTASVTGEKLTEWQVITAFAECGITATRDADCFVLCPAWDDPPFYRLYIEDGVVDGSSFARRFDESLSAVNVEYASKRKSRRLGEVVVCELPRGTLESFGGARQGVRKGGHEQYKHKFLFPQPGDDEALAAAHLRASTVKP